MTKVARAVPPAPFVAMLAVVSSACTAILGVSDVRFTDAGDATGQDASVVDGSNDETATSDGTGEAQNAGDAPSAGDARDAGNAGDAGEAGNAGDAGGHDADAGGGVTLLAYALNDDNSTSLSTQPIDTRGATLLVIAECTFTSGTPKLPTDSQSNTWQSLTAYGSPSAGGEGAIFYSFGPKTSASHVFVDPDSDYNAMAVLAFSGTLTGANVFDSSNGNSTTTGPNIMPGNIVPTQVGELVVSFACSGDTQAATGVISGGFSLVEFLSGNANGSNSEDLGAAYLVTTSLATVSPTWTFTGDSKINSTIASFKVP